MKSSELLKAKSATIAQSRQLLDKIKSENRQPTDEEAELFDKYKTEVEHLEPQIRQAEREEYLELQEASLKHSAGRKSSPVMSQRSTDREPTPLDRKLALRDWLTANTEYRNPSAEAMHRAALCGIDLTSPTLNLRALLKGTGTAGGNVVPQSFMYDLDTKLKYYCNYRQFCRLVSTPDGRDLPWPTLDNTANLAAVEAEGSGNSSTADPTFGQVTLKAARIQSSTVKISVELLADAAFAMEDLITDLLAEQIGREEAALFGGGTGTGQPEGLVGNANITNTVALPSGNALTWQNLIQLVHKIDRLYRNPDECCFVMNDSTMSLVEQFASSTNQPLYSTSGLSILDLQAGDMFRKYKIYIDNNMTGMTGSDSGLISGTPLIYFGNFKKHYAIRDVIGSQTLIRFNEVYRQNGEIGLAYERRIDGRFLRYDAFAAITAH